MLLYTNHVNREYHNVYISFIIWSFYNNDKNFKITKAEQIMMLMMNLIYHNHNETNKSCQGVSHEKANEKNIRITVLL